MISRDLTITVNNNTASLSEPVTVYRGDRGIVLNCKIMQYKFKFNRSSLENVINRSTGIVYARVLVHRPSATDCFEVPMAAVDNDIVVITITKEWLDEEIEMGTYKLQIQLYGEDYENERITIPPVEFNVEDTLCSTPDNFDVFSDKVGVAVAGLLEINENGEAYNSDYANGVYNETKWGSGDIVTANALNKMEDAIDYSVDAIHQLDVNHDSDISALRNELLLKIGEVYGDFEFADNELNNKIDSQDNEIRNSVFELSTDLNSVEKQLQDNVSNSVAEINAKIDSQDTGIRNSINILKADIENDINELDDRKADNTYVQTEISELEAQIAAVEGNVQVNANAISALQSKQEEDVTGINNKIANDIQTAINNLTETHNEDVTAINNKIANDIEVAINELTEQHNADVTEINNKITNDIQTAINNLTETHNEDVTAINNKIANDIEVAINELTEQHNADVTEINNKITNDIQTAINELTEQHNTDINNINTKIDEIELIYYKPSVDNEGNLSWENNGELENPAPINLGDIVSEKLKSDETFNTTLDEYIGAKVEERILLVSSLPSSPKSGYIYIVE